MIPTPWVAVILVLGTYRLVRLIGWDDWPYAVRLRHWLGGRSERGTPFGEQLYPQTDPRGFYKRPMTMKFLTCPFCVGFWLGCIVYVGWLYEPTAVLYVLFPFALNGAVGLLAKNLDP